MKHILPVLTLTTLAAAASAQSAASSGLSYNRVGLAYARQNGQTDYVASAEAVIGSSNFVIGANTTVGGDNGNGYDLVTVGYLLKNAVAGADVQILVGSNETYGVQVRKDLGASFEGTASFVRFQGDNTWGAEVAYNVNKQIQIALGVKDSSAWSDSVVSLGARYNF